MRSTSLAANLQRVQNRIQQAAKRAQRDPSSIQLIAVTKTVQTPVIEELIELGIQNLGENRVQALVEKKAQIAAPVKWHMIGTLQRNKVRKALQAADMIHSIDSLSLLTAVDRISQELEIHARIFLEVHLSPETSKRGFTSQDLPKALALAQKSAHVKIQGLMTMAPEVADPQAVRPYFRSLRELQAEMQTQELLPPNASLSMGMSQDFEIAIEEGANWLRIGRALFQGIVNGKHVNTSH